MTQVLVTEQYLEDITDAIREKNSSENEYTPAQMAGAIEALPGAPVLVQKSITANGSYDPEDDSADGYSDVTVNVPNTYTAIDEGKVVSSGALVAQESKNISQNGTYNTTLNNEVVVNVSGGGGGVELLTRAEWNALTVAQKQAKGLVAIQDYSTGFNRGELVNGTDYIPYNAIRIWTKSTGGYDAALYIQRGAYKDGTFASDDDIYSLVYTQVQSSPIEYFSVISIQYSNGWVLKATSDVEYDNASYTAGQTIKTWVYNTDVDFVVLADVSDE